jgi:hypothetical protein
MVMCLRLACSSIVRACHRDEVVLKELEEKKKLGTSHILTSVPSSVVSTIKMTPDQIEEAIRRKVEQRTREPAAQYREGVSLTSTSLSSLSLSLSLSFPYTSYYARISMLARTPAHMHALCSNRLIRSSSQLALHDWDTCCHPRSASLSHRTR